jgi:hypothetical protein
LKRTMRIAYAAITANAISFQGVSFSGAGGAPCELTLEV